MSASASTLIAPSILAADWLHLADELSSVEKAGADWLHLDVMDGSFVPEISFGGSFIETVRTQSSLPLDVHIMGVHPENHIERFIAAGANRVTFHVEACTHAHRLAQHIRSLGAAPGVAINPGTPIASLKALLASVDLVLVMSVNPGWGGQSFIPETVNKLTELRTLCDEQNVSPIIQVDGGINETTAASVRAVGASCLVAGTYIFGSADYQDSIESLK